MWVVGENKAMEMDIVCLIDCRKKRGCESEHGGFAWAILLTPQPLN